MIQPAAHAEKGHIPWDVSFSCRRFLFDQSQQPWQWLRGAVPEDYDAKRREEFIVKACEHYARYLRRQRDRDGR